MIKQNKIVKILNSKKIKDNVTIKGWIKTIRKAKSFSFIEINDGSCLKSLQIIAEKTLTNYDIIKKTAIGSGIIATGILVESKGDKQKWELIAKKIKIISNITDEYPLQKKHHTNEFLRSIAHLRIRTNKYGAIFRIRSNLFLTIHEFFRNKNFIYVNTPIITSSDCEGAGNMFKIIGKKENDSSNILNSKITNDFFKSEANLTVSGQLSLEMFALSYGDVYTFGPTFRAENSNTSRHVAEFWMLEPEMAFCDLEGIIKTSEEFLKFIISKVIKTSAEDLNFLCTKIDKNLLKNLEKIVTSTFIKVEYKEIIKILQKSNENFKFVPQYGNDLSSEHEHFITEKYFRKPVFILNYPKEIKPFYARINNDGKTVGAVDLLMPRVGELIGGSQREERLDILEKRMDELSIAKEKYWWYLDSRKYGSVTHAGFGMGFERLMMLLTGITNIRDVIPFPRTPGKIEF